MLKGIAFTQVPSDLVKLKNNRELTAKDIWKLIIPVSKTCTEALLFLGHANQGADSIRRTNIATSLPNELYPLAKDVPIPGKIPNLKKKWKIKWKFMPVQKIVIVLLLRNATKKLGEHS